MKARWICCQLGAREHYAVPRALTRQGALACMVTDRWIAPTSGWRERLSAGRFHPELAGAPVHSFNAASLCFEMGERIQARSGWPRIMVRNRWFGRRVARWITNLSVEEASPPPIIFAYSYAALEIFEAAHARGWRTVLGQIDPGPMEERIVAGLHANRPKMNWGPAPAEYWQLWEWEVALADAVVVNSPWSRGGVLEAIPAAANKLHEIPLAHDVSPEARAWQRVYPTTFTASRPLRVLFLGQVILRKGIELLIQAARRLEHLPIEFWIVGPTSLGQDWKDAAPASVRWHGSIARGEAADYYRRADVFVLPTYSDGFALTQLEALAWKLPVIASRFCGEAVVHEKNGWQLDPLTSENLAAILARCAKNPQLLASWASGGDQLDWPFTLETVGRKLETLADTLI